METGTTACACRPSANLPFGLFFHCAAWVGSYEEKRRYMDSLYTDNKLPHKAAIRACTESLIKWVSVSGLSHLTPPTQFIVCLRQPGRPQLNLQLRPGWSSLANGENPPKIKKSHAWSYDWFRDSGRNGDSCGGQGMDLRCVRSRDSA